MIILQNTALKLMQNLKFVKNGNKFRRTPELELKFSQRNHSVYGYVSIVCPLYIIQLK